MIHVTSASVMAAREKRWWASVSSEQRPCRRTPVATILLSSKRRSPPMASLPEQKPRGVATSTNACGPPSARKSAVPSSRSSRSTGRTSSDAWRRAGTRVTEEFFRSAARLASGRHDPARVRSVASGAGSRDRHEAHGIGGDVAGGVVTHLDVARGAGGEVVPTVEHPLAAPRLLVEGAADGAVSADHRDRHAGGLEGLGAPPDVDVPGARGRNGGGPPVRGRHGPHAVVEGVGAELVRGRGGAPGAREGSPAGRVLDTGGGVVDDDLTARRWRVDGKGQAVGGASARGGREHRDLSGTGGRDVAGGNGGLELGAAKEAGGAIGAVPADDGSRDEVGA